MDTFKVPVARYDEMLAISLCFYSREGKQTPPDDINARIAAIVGLPEQPFTTSLDAAFALKDFIYRGYDYVNVDLREYDDQRGLTFICDLRNEYGESSGTRNTRPMAITEALVNHLMGDVQMRKDDGDA